MSIRLLIVIASFSFMLLGCSSKPDAEVKYQARFDFSAIESYGFFARSDSFYEIQSLGHVTRNGVEMAIESALDGQGLTLNPTETADIVITYFWVKEAAGLELPRQQGQGRGQRQANGDRRGMGDRQPSSQGIFKPSGLESPQQVLKRYNRAVNYCSYCLIHSESGEKSDGLSYESGTLIVDIVKPNSRRSIWRASQHLGIDAKDSSLEANDKIIAAVNNMLGQLSLNR